MNNLTTSSNPLFSIIIPLYNKANFVKSTIAQVLNQRFQNFEIIVINDGSTDASLDVVQNIKNDKISIFTTKNQGVSAARNFGVSKARTDYMVFLDADDSWLPNHLENLKNLLDAFPDCGLYCTGYAKKIKSHVYPASFNKVPNDVNWYGIIPDYFESSITNAIAWTSASMVPKSVLLELEGFDEGITFGAGEDTDLWIRIALKYPVAFNNDVTAIHNLHAENRISNTKTDLRTFIDLDKYDSFAKNHPSLKTYLDINRFSIGIKYRLNGQHVLAESYFQKIDPNSLNSKQRMLIKKNQQTLIVLKYLQKNLRKWRINLSPFK
ncbi:glycosyltransferase family 2 protein [Bizionia sp.]|uniref:glycosyltransferase family 2 protein n=1 Tax=Bizionia sp. TaxID=1954480 RepID=UPI003A94FA5F